MTAMFISIRPSDMKLTGLIRSLFGVQHADDDVQEALGSQEKAAGVTAGIELRQRTGLGSGRV